MSVKTQLRFLLPFLLACTAVQAQDHRFLRIDDESLLGALRTHDTGYRSHADRLQEIPLDDKCGFPLIVEALRRLPAMTPGHGMQLTALLAPAARDTSILSASGRFRIHFDFAGRDAGYLLDGDSVRIPGTSLPYARKLAEFFDESYDVEITQLGYTPPPFEDGHTAYNIYVVDLGPSFYGQTKPLEEVPNSYVRSTFTSYIEIDNDFLGFYSKGLAGARVTAAHEFHHMVQLGSYGLWDSSEIYFYEMTSTYMEEAVYPDINDYYQYLASFFRTPEQPLYLWSGYQCVPWMKYLEARFGASVVRSIWETMRKENPTSATASALRQLQSDLALEFCRFARWNCFTDGNASAGGAEHYDDAGDFPLVGIESSLALLAGGVQFQGQVAPLGSQYFRAYRGSDTATFVVSNIDIPSAISKSRSTVGFSIDVQPGEGVPDHQPIGNGWSYRFMPSSADVLCISVVARDAVADPLRKGPYPNPFSPERDGIVRFPISRDVPETRATLFVYTASMDLVHRAEKADITNDPLTGRSISWNGYADDGTVIPSGVYVYALTYGDTTIRGKLAVITR